ncbi:hypothetical protein N7537_005209 [Penicillium hordei]|uniref:Uncharacterized protein n=1 Tax=Penicillium hordei TaxID=40994 RepID=A0AAD6EDW4_9EURO|nr:uncharacterized protein N7537_005209 [Penicillium hordei]KAJ5608590.1 hypothetical protein N7537_005209 [Penicillium hordei]
MASSPSQFPLFATQIASVVTWIGIATFSVLAFLSFKSIIGVTFRSLPAARKLSFGILLVAVQFGFFLLIQNLFPTFFSCPTESAVFTKRDQGSSAASPHWSTHLYGVSGIIWGLHSLCMQEATYWFNSAKWEEEKKEKAARAAAKEKSDSHMRALEVEYNASTERIEILEEANSTIAREATALRRAVFRRP